MVRRAGHSQACVGRLFLVAVAIVLLVGDQANAIDRKIYECSEPFTDTVCTFNRFSGIYNYWFGRSEIPVPVGSGPRGPNPLNGSLDVDKLFEMSGSVQQYYVDRFGRNGVNGLGGTGNGSNVNFLTSYTVILANADGTTIGSSACAGGIGAYTVPNPGYVAVCTGEADEGTLGHEFGHLLSAPYIDPNLDNNTSPIGETGSLTESISDVFGRAFERYATGSYDWVLKKPNGTVFRNMADPPSVVEATFGPYPDRYLSPHFYTGTLQGSGTYHNSTVPSKAAFLAVEGGAFNGFEITGIGFAKVEQIWYRALTMYMEPGETFNQAYDDLIHAATDLYPASDVWEVTKALRAVEMNMSRSFAGDFDNDGDVDASDYVVWRKGLGSSYSQGVYDYWRANFGNGPSSGGQTANVPEPAGIALVGLAALSGMASWCRRG